MEDSDVKLIYKDESVSVTYDSYFSFMVVEFTKNPEEFPESIRILLDRIKNYSFKKSTLERLKEITNVTLGENYVMINIGTGFYSSDFKYYFSDEEISGNEMFSMFLDSIYKLP